MMGPTVPATLWTYQGTCAARNPPGHVAHRTIGGTCLTRQQRQLENGTHTPAGRLSSSGHRSSEHPADQGRVTRRTPLRPRLARHRGSSGPPLSLEHSDHGHANARTSLAARGTAEAFIPLCSPENPRIHVPDLQPRGPSRTPPQYRSRQVSHGLVERDGSVARGHIFAAWDPQAGIPPWPGAVWPVQVLDARRSPSLELACARCVAACAEAIQPAHVDRRAAPGVRGTSDPASPRTCAGHWRATTRDHAGRLGELNGEPTPTGCTCGASSATVHDPRPVEPNEQTGRDVVLGGGTFTLEQLWESAQWEETARARALHTRDADVWPCLGATRPGPGH